MPSPRRASFPPAARALAVAVGFLPAGVAAAPDGAERFQLYCIACHGADARGIRDLGIDLVESGFVAGQSPAALVGFLRQGRLPDDPSSVTGRPMPAFAWVPDSELEALAGYLKSLRAGD